MSTNFTSWNVNLLDLGALYPFPGTEMLWAWIGIATWIIWHIIQIKGENKLLDEEEARFSNAATLKAAMDVSNAETLVETLKTHGSNLR